MKTKLIYIGLFVLLLIGIYLFWGPLFPWSPIKPGYQKIKTSGARIFIHKNSPADSVEFYIDTLLKEEERFHGLSYVDNCRIVIVDPVANMKRFAPWLKGGSYSVSLNALKLIYIGPAAQRSVFGVKSYLKHELSHMLIDQNTSFRKALVIHEQGWLTEGVAEYHSGHHFYSRAEFIDLCRTRGVRFTGLQEQNPLDMSFRDLQINYTYYWLFIDFLVVQYGEDALRAYITRYLGEPQNYKLLFSEVFGAGHDEILGNFISSLNI